jgi:hypothetical protein
MRQSGETLKANSNLGQKFINRKERQVRKEN